MARRVILLAASLVICAFLAGDAGARDPKGHGIKRGVSKQSVQRLRAAARRNVAKNARAFMRRRAAESRAWRSRLSKLQEAVTASLKKHPDFDAYKKQFDAITTAKRKRRGSSSAKAQMARVKALTDLNRRYAPMLKSVWKEVRFNQKGVMSILAGKSRKKQKNMKPLRPLVFLYLAPPASAPPQPPQTSFTLEAFPIPGDDVYSAGGSIGNFTSVEPERARAVGGTFAIGAGQGQAFACLGDSIVLPPGYTRMRVRARMSFHRDLFAGAFLGIARTVLYSYLRVTDHRGQTQEFDREEAAMFALFVGGGSEEGSIPPFTIEREFSIDNEGGDMLVQAGVRSFSGAAFGGITDGIARGTLEWISVDLFP